jgi:hypothetical protein
MPCETRAVPGQTVEQRRKQVLDALRRLDAQLSSGAVTAVVSPQGAVAFVGWTDRDDVTDVCAFRGLTLLKSRGLQRAIAAAEVRSGAKVNPQAVAAGWHSHDGGKTWGRH